MAVILALNIVIASDLFITEYTKHVGSIAAAYVSIARYISDHWGDLSWSPIWYGGVPFQNMYPPLLHVIVAAVTSIAGISPALAYNAVTAVFYCAGPVTLFWLALRLSGDRRAALVSAVIYSILSPSALLIRNIALDMGGALRARRYQTLVEYGEGPHIMSLALLPVAIVALDWAYRKRSAAAFLAAAVSFAAVVLSNWLGGFALAIAIFCFLLARRAKLKDWTFVASLGMFSYALAMPWIPPSTLAAVRTNAQRVGGEYRMGIDHLKYFALLLIAVILVDQWTLRRRIPEYVRFGLLFTFSFGWIFIAGEWFNVYLVPQPHRYHLTLEMGIALLLPLIGRAFLAPLRRNARAGVVAALAVVAILQVRTYQRYARELTRPADFTVTAAYKSGQWLKTHLPDRRILASGTVAFWLNSFSDTPQLSGGFEQGIINPLLPSALFQVYSGMNAGARESEIAILWMRALGVHAVAVNGPNSTDPFKTFKNPDKFNEVLKELWRDRDDVIYEVPHRSLSLARVIDRSAVVPRPPEHGLDVAPLEPYVRGLEDPTMPVADWKWRNLHSGVISATLEPRHLISVQMSWHPGWSAQVNGHWRAVMRDPLNQILIEPHCSGPCTIEMTFDGGIEMVFARIASAAGLLIGIAACFKPSQRRR